MTIDLARGVVPISKAASSLAALIKRAREQHTPIVVTQKGYPVAVLLDVASYTALVAAASVARPPLTPDELRDALDAQPWRGQP